MADSMTQKEAKFFQAMRHGVRSVADTLAGRNVQQEIQKWHEQAMANPIVRRYAKKGGGGVVPDFIRDVLAGRKDFDWGEFEALGGKQRELLGYILEEGIGTVKGQKARTRLARGALAVPTVVAPTAVATTRAVSSPEPKVAAAAPEDPPPKVTPKEVAEKAIPIAAGTVMGTAPILQGIRSGALTSRTTGKVFTDVKEVRDALQRGDVILNAKPGWSNLKALISSIGGDPSGYHVETITGAPKGRAPTFVQSHPALGGAVRYTEALDPGEDIIIRRFKDPGVVKEYAKNVSRMAKEEDALEALMGATARTHQYDMPHTKRLGLRSLLPKPLQRLIPGAAPSTGGTVCSSLTGICSPVSLAPGVAARDIAPHHVRTSKALETVGVYKAPRNLPQKALDVGLKALPWAVRAGVGVGLGYGAYRGAKALMGDGGGEQASAKPGPLQAAVQKPSAGTSPRSVPAAPKVVKPRPEGQ